MKRRQMMKALAGTAALPAVVGAAGGARAAGSGTASTSTGAASAATRTKGSDPLAFDPANYTTLTTTVATSDGDKAVTYRFFKAVTYVADPVDVTYQSLNVSVPVEIDGKAVDASHAPVVFSNAVGGYMPSSTAGNTGIGQGVNAKLSLASGFVVVDPGARGRTLVDTDGVYYGVAPAAIVDLKAAIRYLRHNKGRVPGNTDRIVATGVSAGGALTSLAGTARTRTRPTSSPGSARSAGTPSSRRPFPLLKPGTREACRASAVCAAVFHRPPLDKREPPTAIFH
ncbi:hypothetical protein [Streptomyces avermitilis]|uniref:hypothetical protein n=1 Tax=Streptomyces avermitilis TaxID=33903 RepID=UPI003683565F